MAQCLSAGHRTLVNCTDRIIPLVSDNLTELSSKLFSRKLIKSPLAHGEASQLVQTVIDQVNVFPEKFGVFLDALKEIMTLQDLAVLIQKEYEEIQKEDQATTQVIKLQLLTG